MEPDKKAAHLLLHSSDIARKVCLPVGRDVNENSGGAQQILRIPRECFAPGAIDSIFQDMVKFTYSKRTGQNTDAFITEFEITREKAESRICLGSVYAERGVVHG